MKTKLFNNKSVNVITLGCSKNLVDSEFMLRQLKAAGFEIFHDTNEESDIVIINTCGFINDAKEESVNTILHWANLKNDKKIDKLYVMGCLSERYRTDLMQEIPEVDGFFGVNDLNDLLQQVNAPFRKELISERIITTPPHYAYLKIAEGCDHQCAFCAIPAIRGGTVSKSIDVLIQEAEFLAQSGVKELMLIAQDLTWYGIDNYGKRMLAPLLEQLSKVNGIEWIRLHYAYPLGFPMEILDIMRDNPKICKYIDIPIQHINNRILKSMRRGLNSEDTRNLISEIRRRVPGIAIRTSVIVGYPGESKEAFEELKEFVREARFERLGVFTYSHEEKTPAYDLKDDVRSATKARRAEQIMTLQQSISDEKNQSLIGRQLKVIIDRMEDSYWVGRTEFDSPEVDNEVILSVVAHNNTQALQPGKFVTVKITDAEMYDLHAEIVNE